MKKTLFSLAIASVYAVAPIQAAEVTQLFTGSVKSSAGSYYSSEKLTLDDSEASGVLSPLSISGSVYTSGTPATKNSTKGSVSISITTEKASSSKITNALILQTALGTANVRGYSLNIFTADDTDTIVAAKKNGKITELTTIDEALVAITAGDNSLAISSSATTIDEELSASSSSKLKDITVTIDGFADMSAVATYTEKGNIITTVAKTAESDAETAYTTFTAISASSVSGFATVETETTFVYEDNVVTIGTAFESTPTVENGPTFGSNSWSATGLPTGLKINASTGKISGIIEYGAALTYSVKVILKNAYGTFNDNVSLEVAAE